MPIVPMSVKGPGGGVDGIHRDAVGEIIRHIGKLPGDLLSPTWVMFPPVSSGGG